MSAINPKPTVEELRNLLKEEQDKTLPLVKQELSNDLFKFNKFMLQAEDGNDKVKLSGFHDEMCKFVSGKNKRKLILVPRGHLKSSLVTIGYALFRLVKDPSIRILIANATYEMSVSFLGEIKKHLKYNEDLKSIFGSLADDPVRWAENMITLQSAKESFGRKEANITTYGMGGNLVSQHYDLMIFDDLVNGDNTMTLEQLEKTKRFYREAQSLLEPNGSQIILGTRWHDRDLYGWLLDKDNGMVQMFETFIKPSYEGSLDDEANLKILWPEKFSAKYLKSLRADQGPYLFACNFQNNPVPDQDATFRRDWFRYYDKTDMKGKIVNRFMAVDPAISLEKEADYTGIVIVGINEFDDWFIEEIVRVRTTPDNLINLIFSLNEQWHPQSIGIEDVAFQKILQYQIREEMKRRNRFLPIRELRPEARAKDYRIRGLQPLYANGKVYHCQDLMYNEYLEDELTRFPRGKHDDIIDALSYILDIAFKPKQIRRSYSQKTDYLYA